LVANIDVAPQRTKEVGFSSRNRGSAS
jgi:hypothetical protein